MTSLGRRLAEYGALVDVPEDALGLVVDDNRATLHDDHLSVTVSVAVSVTVRV